MALERELKVQFLGDASSLSRTMRTVSGDVDRTSSRFSRFGGVMKAGFAAAGVAAGAAAIAIGKFAIDSVQAAAEAAKVTDQTAAVIKSMGIESQVTADEIANLSEKLAMMAGVDDDAIQSGVNLLLTFKNLTPIIDEVTGLTLDMSVAMGTDMRSAAIQVGKALNDPITGLTALRRVGVSFTEQQQEQITTLVEQGELLKAQRIIMKELENQFGGSARAQANAMDRVKVAIDNVQESIGEALLPIVNRLARRLARFVGSKEFQAWLKDAQRWVRRVAKDIEEWDWKGFINDVRDATNAVRRLVEWFKRVDGSKPSKEIGKVGWSSDEAGQKVRRFVLAVARGFRDVYNSVKDWLGRAVDWIDSAFDGADRWLADVGGDIVDGLLGGLSSAWTRVTSWISQKIAEIPAAAKRLLGISSPSKVFEEIGQEVARGFAKGAGGIGASMSVPSVSTGSTSAVTPAMAGVGGVNINFYGPVYGGDDFDRRVDIAIERLSKVRRRAS